MASTAGPVARENPGLGGPEAAPLGPLGSFTLAAAGVGTTAAFAMAPAPFVVLCWPLAVSIFHFSMTPVLTRVGFFRYHSRMLKATIRTRSLYEIHAGTSFDFLSAFRWSDRDPAAARQFLVWVLEGLLDIASLVERGDLPGSVRIVGTSYFFREASAWRLGFTVQPATLRLRLNLLLNILDITWMYSFCRGRIAFPNVLAAREAAIRGDELAARKGDILKLIERLRRRRPAGQRSKRGRPGRGSPGRPAGPRSRPG